MNAQLRIEVHAYPTPRRRAGKADRAIQVFRPRCGLDPHTNRSCHPSHAAPKVRPSTCRKSTRAIRRHLRQRLDVKQPSLDMLEWLAARNDLLLNAVEISLELIFERDRDARRMVEFLDAHLARRWHGRRQRVIQYKNSRYDGSYGSPNSTKFYRSTSKITGEVACVRINGVAPAPPRVGRSVSIPPPIL